MSDHNFTHPLLLKNMASESNGFYAANIDSLHTLESGVDFQITQLRLMEDGRTIVRFYTPAKCFEYIAVTDMSQDSMEELLLHRHDFFELMLVLNGQVEAYIEGGHNTFATGDACIVNRNTRHLEANKFSDVVYLGMSRDFIQNSYFPSSPLVKRKGKFDTFFQRNLDDQAKYLKDYMSFTYKEALNGVFRAKELVAELIQELEKQGPGYLSIVHGLTARLLAVLEDDDLYNYNYVNLSSGKEAILAEDIRRLLERAKRRVTSGEIANSLNYNGDYLNRIFKKWYGLSMKEYCQKIYMKETVRLLTETDLSITQIANRVGFVNPTQFYHIFKDYYGCTPQDYRMQKNY